MERKKCISLFSTNQTSRWDDYISSSHRDVWLVAMGKSNIECSVGTSGNIREGYEVRAEQLERNKGLGLGNIKISYHNFCLTITEDYYFFTTFCIRIKERLLRNL